MANHGTFKRSFRQFTRALNQSHKDKVFLSDGTLLGFVRENDFIDGDDDIDVAMFVEDYDASVIDSVARAGFVLTAQSGTEEDGLSFNFRNGQMKIDLTLFYTTTSGHTLLRVPAQESRSVFVSRFYAGAGCVSGHAGDVPGKR